MDLMVIIGSVIGGVILVSLLVTGYVVAKPNEAIIITGLGKQRILMDGSTVIIPGLQRKSYVTLEQFSIDVQTADYVPTSDFINVKADAVVKVRIPSDRLIVQRAAKNFLNWSPDKIAESIDAVLEGNLREIIGQMRLKDMVNNRQDFSEKVQQNASPDLDKMGLEIVSFNVQTFSDDGDVIKNLGIDNIVTIKKDAAIARAKAEREQREVEAAESKAANDAKVASDLEIAKKNNDLAIERAKLKRISDIEKAQADAAYRIEEETQRKSIEQMTADANIMKQQKESEVKAEAVKVREMELNAEIRKKAEADKYAREKAAEADLIERQRKAEAELFEKMREAEAKKAEAEADKYAKEQESEGIRAKGIAEAEAIRAKLEAEAEGLNKKAEAMKKYGEAAILEMYFRALPEVAKNVAAPLANVDKITMYGEGNSAKMVGDITTSIDQINQALGFDVKSLLIGALGSRVLNDQHTDEETI